MPFVGAEVKEVFEELEAHVSPDLIFTHNRKDAHQDHRLLAELTWNTFRNHLILEYEIPKYDGDWASQACSCRSKPETVQERRSAIMMDAFQSQRSKRWFRGGDVPFPDAAPRDGMQCCRADTPRPSTAASWCYDPVFYSPGPS